MKHWSSRVHEITVARPPDGRLPFSIVGGAQVARFPYVGDPVPDIPNVGGSIPKSGHIILEANGTPLGGLTNRDVLAIIANCSEPLRLKLIKAGRAVPYDLRMYLNRHFATGSIDHVLQQNIRDNLYLRTIPCTTRPPREGEVPGVDYNFISEEEFLFLEQSGALMETGTYNGHFYGTPKPPADPGPLPLPQTGSGTTRPRSRSVSSMEHRGIHSGSIGSMPPESPQVSSDEESVSEMVVTGGRSGLHPSHSESFEEPLPGHWEVAVTEKGETYFIDHKNQTTSWLDPRKARLQKPLEECADDELPYGWERIDDPKHGTYYVDHLNRKTQFENPVLEAKRLKKSKAHGVTLPRIRDGEDPSRKRPRSRSTNDLVEQDREFLAPSLGTGFAATLRGAAVTALLRKTSRGFGFTVVGGDSPGEPVQVRGLVPGGPATEDGHMAPGDVITHVDGECVLGRTQSEVVDLLRTAPIGATVRLDLCRGYPLPIDSITHDPNSRVAKSVPDLFGYDSPLYPFDTTHDSSFRHGNLTQDPNYQPHDERCNMNTRTGPAYETTSQLYDPNYNNISISSEHSPRVYEKSLDREAHPSRPSFSPSLDMRPNTFTEDDELQDSVLSSDHQLVEVSVVKGAATMQEVDICLHPEEPGFGFRLVGGEPAGEPIRVGALVPGGAAERDGRLHPGDELLAIDGVPTIGIPHARAVSLMQRAARTGRARLRLRYITQSPTFPYSENTMEWASYSEQDAYPESSGAERSPPLPQTVGGSTAGMKHYDITITRNDEEGFGFVIISSLEHPDNGASIGHIVPEGAAAREGHLQVGDRVVAIDGETLVGLTHADIVSRVAAAEHRITLTVSPSRQGSIGSPTVNGSNKPSSKTTDQSGQSLSGKPITEMLIPDRAARCADQPKWPPSGQSQHVHRHENNRFDKRSRQDLHPQTSAIQEGTFYMVELERGPQGFGFSVRGGREAGIPLLVLRLADGGPAALSGRMQIGDELVEIGGESCHGMSHSRALQLIRGSGQHVSLLLHRGTGRLPAH
uniref:membrane-associated guanylate kinase, WW and PDZ domain-containing protein 2-like n=1 Tax=Myxine glutinosa TaxID=7769 RepID=UPI00358FE81B